MAPSLARHASQPAASRAACFLGPPGCGMPLPSSKVCVKTSRQPSSTGSSSQRRSWSPQLYASSRGGSNSVNSPSRSTGSCSRSSGMSAALGASSRNTKRILAPRLRSPSISVGNHCRSCSASVRARHTFSGGWASRRSNRSTYFSSSRSSSVPSAAWGWESVRMSLLLVEVLFEGIQATGPELAIRAQPAIDLRQGLGLQPVPAALGIAADLDQSSLAQRPQMLADAGLTQADLLHQLADRALSLAQQVENAAPHWLGDQLERGCHTRANITKELYNCQGIKALRTVRACTPSIQISQRPEAERHPSWRWYGRRPANSVWRVRATPPRMDAIRRRGHPIASSTSGKVRCRSGAAARA